MGFRATILILILLAIGIFAFVDLRLKPTLLAYAEVQASVLATQAINSAINEKIAISIKYEDLMSFKMDSRGRVVAVQPNTGEINRLSSETAIYVQSLLKQTYKQPIKIPMGQVLGSSMFANMPPYITVTIRPVGWVQTNVVDTFEHTGINQSRHKIYLEVKTQVRIIVPLISSTVQIESKVPIAESIILGEVPQVYFGIDRRDN